MNYRKKGENEPHREEKGKTSNYNSRSLIVVRLRLCASGDQAITRYAAYWGLHWGSRSLRRRLLLPLRPRSFRLRECS